MRNIFSSSRLKYNSNKSAVDYFLRIQSSAINPCRGDGCLARRADESNRCRLRLLLLVHEQVQTLSTIFFLYVSTDKKANVMWGNYLLNCCIQISPQIIINSEYQLTAVTLSRCTRFIYAMSVEISIKWRLD